MTIQLRGIAEGLTGMSEIESENVAAVFLQYPQLSEVSDKLCVTSDSIVGYTPCDG